MLKLFIHFSDHQARSPEALFLLVMDGELHLAQSLAQLHLNLSAHVGHLPHIVGLAKPHLHPIVLASDTNLNS